MDCSCDTPGLMPVEQALLRIAQHIQPITENQQVELDAALGRILAEPIVSPINAPPQDNSAMDGYALRQGDASLNTPLQLIGKSFAGAPFTGRVEPGQCVRIMTGACIPEGADTVIMQENVSTTHTTKGEQIHLNSVPGLGEAIRHAGEDITRNEVVFNPGHQLSPVDIGLLASLGIDRVKVYRRPRVAVFSTGDELAQPGQPLGPGGIYDANRPVLKAMLSRCDVDVIDLGVIPDSKSALTEAFTQADQEADLVLTTGGVSVGEADYTREVLASMGQMHFWKLAIKPGKPLAFGQLPNSIFFGLPGNPVSAVVTFHQIALPCLLQLAGRCRTDSPLELSAQATSEFKKKPGRKDFQRGICQIDGQGQLTVTSTGNQSSGVLSSISQANCYVVLETECGTVNQGETVKVRLFDHVIAH